MKSQVTTGRGDLGTSSALDGHSYSKSHPIMECVGTVDELRAHTALLRLQVLESKPQDHEAIAEFLLWLIRQYFVLGSSFSDPLNRHPEYHMNRTGQEEVDRLEQEQQRIELLTPLSGEFILSAANPVAAQCDITCTVARRLERRCVLLKETMPEFDASRIVIFLNRLSDYLYMLARRLDRAF